ncbi:YciI family protein [Roseibium sp. FZY0029]|uniref:YciI family protein n=1 Tax=Roseibium sp. FZY0029 TaxID=3116647 RepID=UPI002EAC37A5|nr:YciI family protein [Roseibium sp. FZY0029]
MLYSVLIFGVEGVAERLPREEHEALLDMHRNLQAKLQAEGKYRGSVQLMPPSTAMTVGEKGGVVTVLDGPFAESKEQILGFYLIECDTIDEAIEAAKALPQGVATMEVRLVSWTGGL